VKQASDVKNDPTIINCFSLNSKNYQLESILASKQLSLSMFQRRCGSVGGYLFLFLVQYLF
jgi:hypothetical protein